MKPREADRDRESLHVAARRIRYAVPTELDATGTETVCEHFGHAPFFTLIDVDPRTGDIVRRKRLPAPPHEPGLLPRWIHEQGAEFVLTGGMGHRAVQLFVERGIVVVSGVTSGSPDEAALSHFSGKLVPGDNACSH